MHLPVRPICASALGCGTLYHVRKADSKLQEVTSLLGSTVPLKYRTNVSPESVNTVEVMHTFSSPADVTVFIGNNNSPLPLQFPILLLRPAWPGIALGKWVRLTKTKCESLVNVIVRATESNNTFLWPTSLIITATRLCSWHQCSSALPRVGWGWAEFNAPPDTV